jgi:PAS domain S-box-containing protein
MSCDLRLVRACGVVTGASAAFGAAAGLLALAGWKAHIAVLTTWGAAPVRIAPDAAACAILLALSLWLQRKPIGRSAAWTAAWARKVTAKTSAAIVVGVGLLSLMEHALGRDFGIDQWLVAVSPAERVPGLRPGLMAMTAALECMILGSALLLQDWKTRRQGWATQWLVAGAAMGAVFGFFALLLQPRATFITMALPAAAGFFVLACGLLHSRPTLAIGGLLVSSNAGARLLRKAIPPVFSALTLIGWVVSKVLLTEAYFSWAEASLLAILCGALLIGFVTWIAFIVDRSDVVNTQLERRVAERTMALQSEVIVRQEAERALRLLSDCNDALARATDELALLRRICDLVVNAGGYRMAWVGYAEQNRKKTVRVMAQSGLDAGYLDAANVTWTENDHGRGPAGTAIRTRMPTVCRDMASDPLFAPWRDRALQAGYRSCLSLPLKNDQETLGALSVYASRAQAFDDAEQRFLQELAANLSFGIVALRALAEHKREESMREHLAAVVESCDDAIISKSLHGTITAWNPSAERLFGYSAAEAIGQSMLMLLPPDRAEEEADILACVGRGARVEHFETVRIRKDGSTLDVSVTISPIRDRGGTIVGASKVARDITERKQAVVQLAAQTEELSRQAGDLERSRLALEAQTLMLQSVLDGIAEGLVATDAQGKFVLWNPAAERIIGMNATDLPLPAWPEHYGLYLPDTVTHIPADQMPLARALRGDASTTEVFVRNSVVFAGTWIEVSAGPLTDQRGARRGAVAAFRDITQQKTDQHEIRQLNDELEIRVLERTAQLQAANHELESFSYSVSHDLRAPLRHIGGFSQLLMEEFGPSLAPEAQRYLQRIQSGTQKMGQLVDELLSLARVGRHPLRLERIALHVLVAELIAMLEPESAGRQVEWQVADLPSVECDPVLVRQIFQNLLSNALKFTRSRRRAVIEVSQHDPNGQPVFMVRDNGVGFDMKYVNKLFGVFQRLHREEDFEGTGIGLATVQRIVHKHGGRVWAEAAPDKGATFYFTLGAKKQVANKRTAAATGDHS